MEIHGPGSVPEIGKIVPDRQIDFSKAIKPSEVGKKEDSVLISEVSKLLNKVASLPPVRQEKVDQIKAEIAKGDYITEEKLNVTISRILEELGE